MELRVGDIVIAQHKTLPTLIRNPTRYKVIKLRDNENTIPSVIQRLDDNTTQEKLPIKDLWNDWHSYNWIVYKRIEIAPLSEADKKYEKIILKIRTLDHKFKTRKELK